MKKETLILLVKKATEGDNLALEEIILSIKDLVYNLSLRMLLFSEDAKDATQEILIKVVTNLGSYKGESAFTTWVYSIASNYLLTVKGKMAKQFALPFEEYAEMLDTGHSESINYTQNEGEQLLLEEEVKVSCTHGLLLCLNEKSRLVYILGEILNFDSQIGADILDLTPENFRQILSRSRKQIRNFLQAKCGLMNPSNPCRCKKKVDFLIDREAIDPNNLRFAQHSKRSIELVDQISEIERSATIYRSTPQFATPESIVTKMKEIINLTKS